MTATTTPLALSLPAGTVQRIRTHYGEFGEEWLETAIDLIQQAAASWNVTVVGFHDRGWASVVAYGRTADHGNVMIKAVLDSRRYASELAALRHWDGVSAGRVINVPTMSGKSCCSAWSGRFRVEPYGRRRSAAGHPRSPTLPLHRKEAQPGGANTDVGDPVPHRDPASAGAISRAGRQYRSGSGQGCHKDR